MKCKHGLTIGTCWTCKTGERIKEPVQNPKRVIRGDGLFHAIEVKHPGGKMYSRWQWMTDPLKMVSRSMGLDEKKCGEWEKN